MIARPDEVQVSAFRTVPFSDSVHPGGSAMTRPGHRGEVAALKERLFHKQKKGTPERAPANQP